MDTFFTPRKVSQNLSVQKVDQETLVYDERRHRAFCLDRLASAVWEFCDGEHTIAAIAAAASLRVGSAVEQDAVLVALAQFDRDGLLEREQQQTASPDLMALGEVSRRAMIGRLGVGAALMLPVVAAIVAPKAAHALSGSVTGSSPAKNQAIRNNQQSQGPSK